MKTFKSKIILLLSVILIIISIVGYISLYTASIDLRYTEGVITQKTIDDYCEAKTKSELRYLMPYLFLTGLTGIAVGAFGDDPEYGKEATIAIIVVGTLLLFFLAVNELPKHVKRLSDISSNEPSITKVTVTEKQKIDYFRSADYFLKFSNGITYKCEREEYYSVEEGERIYAISCGDTYVVFLNADRCTVEKNAYGK